MSYIESLVRSSDSLKLILQITSPDSNSITDTRVIWAYNLKDVSLSIAYTTAQRLSQDIICEKLQAELLESSTHIKWNLSANNMEVSLVRNRFHAPKSPADGVLIYTGPENSCDDRHSSRILETWYSLFATNSYGDWILLKSVWVQPRENDQERLYVATGVDQFELFLMDECRDQPITI